MASIFSNRLRLAWVVLGLTMVAAAIYLLLTTRNLTFSGDELYYFSHLTNDGYAPTPAHGVEYFFTPHNDHFVLVGRLIYEALFAVFGTDYFVFRLVEILGILACVGLLFTLASRRLDPLLALAPCVLLLFLGFGYETLLWPFNLHTVYSLAFGLGALLALERDDRLGDRLACGLLILSVATVEVGLAVAVGVGLSVLMRPDRRRRLWIVLVPVALYATWWIWARKFEQPSGTLLNADLIPIDIGKGFAAVIGSLTGVNATGVEVPPQLTGIPVWAALLAGAAAITLVLRVWRGRVPKQFWIVATILVAYWATIALGDRPPDSSRYIFPGAVLVLLLAACALERVRVPTAAVTCVWVVALVAIPFNLEKLYEGRRLFLNDAAATRTEDAMLELSWARVNPGYSPAGDPGVVAQAGGALVPISAEAYFRGAREYGSLAYTLQQVRDEQPPFRAVADATLIGALEVGLEPTSAPADPADCPRLKTPAPGRPTSLELPEEGFLLSPLTARPAAVGLIRFETLGGGVPIGTLRPGKWARLRIPVDSAPDPWKLVVDQSVYLCQP